MRYRTIGAVGLALLLLGSLRARAAEGTTDDDDDDAKPVKAALPSAVEDAPAATPVVAAKTDDDVPASAHMEVGPAPTRPPVYGKRGDWFIVPYGYARVDDIEDSTQSFADGIEPNLIARVGTYKGDHRRNTFTAKDSRLGIFVGAPTYQGIKSSVQIELDFYGLLPSDARINDTIVFSTPRIRHAFLKMETKVVDVIAGQYHDLFGWGSYFFPATVSYLGVPGEIYHRDPQIRLEKKLELGQLEIMAAVAAVHPGERDSGYPDGQAGLKISYRGWSGAMIPGFGRPTFAPLSIAVSGVVRHFEVPSFAINAGSEAQTANGYGVAAQLLLPIIPIKTLDDRSNALTLTGEFSTGSGIADLYTGMDGGSRFPLLPNATGLLPEPAYPSNVDPGLVTFDRASNLKTLTWNAVVAGAQYYLPVSNGRAWLSGTYSRIWSPDIKDLTPFASWGAIFTKMEYIDANIGFDITPSLVLAASLQTVEQTFGDVSSAIPATGITPSPGVATPPGTGGGAPVTARNNRGQISMALFF
jgi:hypothetical protein